MPIIASSVTGYTQAHAPSPPSAALAAADSIGSSRTLGGAHDGTSVVTDVVCRHLLGDAFDPGIDLLAAAGHPS